MSTIPEPDSLALPAGRIEGRTAFEEAVRVSMEVAAREGWKSLCWMDADFSDWPLGERRMEKALQDWSRTGRQMVILARSYDKLASQHHRFVIWRRQWAHIIECWQCPQADANEFPSGIFTDTWALQRVDRERGVCHAGGDAHRILALGELRNLWLTKSTRGFPANVLGL